MVLRHDVIAMLLVTDISGSQVSEGKSKLCQTEAPLLPAKRTKLPVSSSRTKSACTTFSVTHTTDPKDSPTARRPLEVRNATGEAVLTGDRRLATQTYVRIGIEAYQMPRYRLDPPSTVKNPSSKVPLGLKIVVFPTRSGTTPAWFSPLFRGLGLRTHRPASVESEEEDEQVKAGEDFPAILRDYPILRCGEYIMTTGSSS
ncbi:hypothetical protein HPP92_025789 [Vanilla planifolia]|uniref:Uncharacterized protein n=1 Tax=Vanilla planifolia TaxID=51239 RepID=A0A835PG06_VANPL|nr:hypothetical protein HPP92_025789 [Vanilla planifolia]